MTDFFALGEATLTVAEKRLEPANRRRSQEPHRDLALRSRDKVRATDRGFCSKADVAEYGTERAPLESWLHEQSSSDAPR